MGLNQSLSCHAASSCAVIPASISCSSSWTAPYTGSIKDRNVVEPCSVAKVLLLDGHILHFTGAVTALQVLESFRHHCLCPLDSVSQAPPHKSTAAADNSVAPDTITTFFRPVCLLPNDMLRPNCVYILLPRRTFRLFAAAAAAATRNRATGVRGSEGMRRWCSDPNRSRKVCDSAASSLSTGSKACESKQAHRANDKSAAGAPVVLHDTTTRVASDTQHNPAAFRALSARHRVLSTSSLTQKCQAPIYSTPHRSLSLDLRRNSDASQYRRRAPSMRRCRSWRPRLAVINEVQAFS